MRKFVKRAGDVSVIHSVYNRPFSTALFQPTGKFPQKQSHKGDRVSTFHAVVAVVVVAFSALTRIFGECSTIHSPPALFFVFLSEVEIRSRTLILLLGPGSVHSGSAS